MHRLSSDLTPQFSVGSHLCLPLAPLLLSPHHVHTCVPSSPPPPAQCLWHCESFRQGIERSPPEAYSGQPVVLHLAKLFRALSQAQSGMAAGEER